MPCRRIIAALGGAISPEPQKQLHSNKRESGLSLIGSLGEKILPEVMWEQCIDRLQHEIPAKQFNTWIRPLHAARSGACMRLVAPNRFIRDFVNERFMPRIAELLVELNPGEAVGVVVEVDRPGMMTPDMNLNTSQRLSDAGSTVASIEPDSPSLSGDAFTRTARSGDPRQVRGRPVDTGMAVARAHTGGSSVTRARSVPRHPGRTAGSAPDHQHKLVANYTFQSFVEGKSNQLAVAAARQVAENPGQSYNPLFLYGGVGLGKTHLMHAVGNALREENPGAKIVYLHSETFVGDMVKALQLNAISEFKRFYRTVDALLIDDIQFFAKKERSQEEFFHTFNALLEGGQQMILTCDRYPKQIDGLEERLKSRFGWGLTVAVEPPELETRAAILMKKAEESDIELPREAAFFIAQRIRSNVRELEGALRRVIANAKFTGAPIDVPLVKDSLKDLLALQDKQVSLDNIQRTVADYYKIKVADLMSRRRNRSVARPRQVAMALAKELTSHSLPEIGDSFGGRDHTTVIHACRKIEELRDTNSDIQDDYKNLLRSLTT